MDEHLTRMTTHKMDVHAHEMEETNVTNERKEGPKNDSRSRMFSFSIVSKESNCSNTCLQVSRLSFINYIARFVFTQDLIPILI